MSHLRAAKYVVRVKTPRGLWREVLYAADSWPAGRDDALRRARSQFADNRALEPGSADARRALRGGEWMVSQMHELARFHRYRTLKKRYGAPPEPLSPEEADVLARQLNAAGDASTNRI